MFLFLFFLFQQIKAIADTGCTVIVSGGKVGELAQHFCNKYKILVVRLMSKWDLRRLCRSLGATPLPRIVSYSFYYDISDQILFSRTERIFLLTAIKT